MAKKRDRSLSYVPPVPSGAGGTPDALRDETSTGVARSSNVVKKIALERLPAELDGLFEPSTRVLRKGKAGEPDELGNIAKLQEAENSEHRRL